MVQLRAGFPPTTTELKVGLAARIQPVNCPTYKGYVCGFLIQITKEKVDLENQLEVEQEYIVNKLQKQVGGSICVILGQLSNHL